MAKKGSARVVLSIAGAAAEEKLGRFGFFEGSYTAILQFIQRNGLVPENIVTTNQKNSGDNFFLFYWKG